MFYHTAQYVVKLQTLQFHYNMSLFNTLRLRQDGRYFADDVLKCIFLNENVWISLKIPLKFVPKGPVNNIPALVQIMAGRRPGNKPLSEPMLVFVSTHICVTRPQWVKTLIVVRNNIQYGAIIMGPIFSKIITKDTPHSLPIRMRYGVPFVGSNSSYSASVTIMESVKTTSI